jgi:hypothetical protein
VAQPIPARVHRFVLDFVDSLELLEVVLLLAAEPQVELSPDDVSVRLRTTPPSARARLEQLVGRGLAEPTADGRFKLRSSAELAETLDAVARCYRERRVSMVSLIYSRPSELVHVFTEGSDGDENG